MQTWGCPSAFDFVDHATQRDMRTASTPREQFVEIQQATSFFKAARSNAIFLAYQRRQGAALGAASPWPPGGGHDLASDVANNDVDHAPTSRQPISGRRGTMAARESR